MLKFRKIKDSDLEKIMAWRMSPNVTKYMFTDPVITLENQKRWFEKINEDSGCRYWIVSESLIDIGVVAITDMTKEKCDLAWYIGEDGYRGKGIGTCVLLNLFDYVFNKLKLDEIYSQALEDNTGAVKLYQKCGFKIQNILENGIIKNGEPHNVVVLKIMRNDWAAIKDGFEYERVFFEE